MPTPKTSKSRITRPVLVAAAATKAQLDGLGARIEQNKQRVG